MTVAVEMNGAVQSSAKAVAVVDPSRPWMTTTLADAVDELRRAVRLAADQRAHERADATHAAVYRLSAERAEAQAEGWRKAIAAANPFVDACCLTAADCPHCDLCASCCGCTPEERTSIRTTDDDGPGFEEYEPDGRDEERWDGVVEDSEVV